MEHLDFQSEKARDWLRNLLQTTEKVAVTFTKVDGSTRTMQCTLVESFTVPYENKTTTKRVPNPDILRVWDLEKNEWRGFRFDSIQSIGFSLEDVTPPAGVTNGN